MNAARIVIEKANQRIVTEATQRERLALQLREAQKMEAIGQLSGGLAHDFNNMLSVIMGSLNLIKRRLARGDTNLAELIEGGLDGAQRAATLTNRLLAFARQQPLTPEPVDVNKFVAKMSDLLRHTLGDHIRLETVLGGGIWRTCIDASQLENSILNLCVNARDAMPQGGKLTIETANTSLDDAYTAEHGVPPGQYVLIAVTDTGAGMSAETVQKAFDPFFTTKTGKGTGLGLSQVYGFARQSGGHAKIYSELCHGTTVKLYLPRYMGQVEQTSVVVAKRDMDTLRGGPQETVLVVEDDEQVRSLTVKNLEEPVILCFKQRMLRQPFAFLTSIPKSYCFSRT
jgi:signal transduction histidine kinase